MERNSGPARSARTSAAAEGLTTELRRLRLAAGNPSFRTMARAAGSISHTTLHEAASGARIPSWPTTSAFVRACGGDEAAWRRRWTAAVGGEPPAAPAPAAPPVPATAPTARGHRIRTHTLSLLLGVVLGTTGTLGLTHLHPSAAATDPRPALPQAGTFSAPPGSGGGRPAR
ncbi:helix-turn-helix domain-containing protein [Kitasatospora sp. NPDC094019]|uniref:helix-turn-helix domain-containing protein n=1 Tax=Kitasatospora sp. NPDC094019 TaxID=3364091 RepID=UPI0038038A0C